MLVPNLLKGRRKMTIRVGEEESEFDMQSKFVSQALEMVYQKPGGNDMSLINQF